MRAGQARHFVGSLVEQLYSQAAESGRSELSTVSPGRTLLMRSALFAVAVAASALAARAGLTFASVDPRFADKDGLMREVFMRVAEMNYEMG